MQKSVRLKSFTSLMIIIALLITLCSSVLNLYVKAESSDVIAPSIERVTMDHKEASIGDSFAVYVYASDESGIAVSRSFVYVYRVPENDSEELKKERAYLQATDEPGKYVATFNVTEAWTSGQYKIYWINVDDNHNNTNSFFANIGNPDYNPEWYPNDAIVDVTGGNNDAIVPTINKATMNNNEVKAGDSFDVSVYASDESGIAVSRSFVYVYRVPETDSEELKKERAYLQATDEPGKYVATFNVSEAWTSGQYKIYWINVTDNNNNTNSFFADIGNANNNPDWYPNDARVVVAGGNKDVVVPTIQKVTMDNKEVEAGDSFDVYVYASDESGIAVSRSFVYVYRVPETDSEELKKERAYLQTTDEPGKYVATFNVTSAWASGQYKIYWIDVEDNNNNTNSFFADISKSNNNPEWYPNNSYIIVDSTSSKNAETTEEPTTQESSVDNAIEVEVGKQKSLQVKYPSNNYSVVNGNSPVVYSNSDSTVADISLSSISLGETESYLGFILNGLKEGSTTIVLFMSETGQAFAAFNVKVVPAKEEPTTQKQEEPTSQKQEEPTSQKQEEPTSQKQEEPTSQKQEEPSTQKQEEPTTQKQEEPTTQKQEEPTTQKQKEPTTQKQEEPTTRKDEPTSVIKRNGLADSADKDGVWWYYTDGKIDRTHTGVDQNKYGWWRVENGKVNFKAQGIYQNQYGWWKTTDGEVTFKENSIYQNEFGWWKCKDSKVDFTAQSIYQNKHGWWKTTDGKVTFKENGLFKNQYGTWKVENSKVNFNFNGKYQGKTIKNGKVV